MQMHKHIICLYRRGEILAYSGTWRRATEGERNNGGEQKGLAQLSGVAVGTEERERERRKETRITRVIEPSLVRADVQLKENFFGSCLHG